MGNDGLAGRSVLVTGGAGFVGSQLTNTLVNDNEVTVYDSLTSGRRATVPEESDLIEADIRDDSTFEQAVADVDVVFHGAALVSVAQSIEEPPKSHTTTAVGILNVLEAAREHDTSVVLASSAAVYGQPENIPIEENHPKTPTSPYGLDKLAADHYARLYHGH